jgi:hypothetical protein
MLWKSDDETARLRQEVAELKEQVGKCRCEPSLSKEFEPVDLKQFLKEIKEREREEELEARWQREQERLERRERFRNKDLNFLLEQTELDQPNKKDDRSKSSSNNGGGTIDWRGIPLIVVVMVLAWVWFNRPVSNSNRYPSPVQPIQVLR